MTAVIRRFADYTEPEEGKPKKKPVRAADQVRDSIFIFIFF
jgi:hypothetical protein